MERRGIPYTGARRESSQRAFDKVLRQERFLEAGVITPASEVIFASKSDQPAASIGIPCVVKPPREGSSVGVHLVRSPEQWPAAFADAAKYSDDLLVEELISGKELTVGIVGDRVLPVIHIQPRSGFYDISNKYPWMTGQGGRIISALPIYPMPSRKPFRMRRSRPIVPSGSRSIRGSMSSSVSPIRLRSSSK